MQLVERCFHWMLPPARCKSWALFSTAHSLALTSPVRVGRPDKPCGLPCCPACPCLLTGFLEEWVSSQGVLQMRIREHQHKSYSMSNRHRSHSISICAHHEDACCLASMSHAAQATMRLGAGDLSRLRRPKVKAQMEVQQ